MRFDFMMLADRVREDESGKLDIRGGGLTHILASEFPYTLDSLAIILRVFVIEDDATVPHPLVFRVLAPDGGVLAELGGTIPPVSETGERGVTRGHPGEDAFLIVITVMQGLTFKTPGRHIVEASLDNEVIAERGIALVPTEESSLS